MDLVHVVADVVGDQRLAKSLRGDQALVLSAPIILDQSIRAGAEQPVIRRDEAEVGQSEMLKAEENRSERGERRERVESDVADTEDGDDNDSDNADEKFTDL